MQAELWQISCSSFPKLVAMATEVDASIYLCDPVNASSLTQRGLQADFKFCVQIIQISLPWRQGLVVVKFK